MPEHPRAARGPLRRAAGRRRPRRHELAPRRRRRSSTSCSDSERPRTCSSTASSRSWSRTSTSTASRPSSWRTPASPTTPTRSSWPPARDGPLESWLEDENEPIAINYTSGTTGRSKGAVYTHRGAYLRAHGVALEIRLGYDSVHLWTLPMFHCNGWCLTWGVTAAGGTHVCLRKVDPERIWELFESEGVTHYSGAPTVHMSIVNHENAHPLEQRVIVPTGGSPPTPTLLAQDARAQPAPDPPLRPDRDLRPRHGLQLAAAVGRAVGRGAGEAALAPGPHLQRLRPRPGRRRGHGRRAARRARRSARS